VFDLPTQQIRVCDGTPMPKPAKRSGSNARKARVEATAEAPISIKPKESKPERKPIGDRQRFRILHRFNHTCVYCGAKAGDELPDGSVVKMHVDHKVSVKDGGTNADENLVAACARCNGGKSSKSVRGVGATKEVR